MTSVEPSQRAGLSRRGLLKGAVAAISSKAIAPNLLPDAITTALKEVVTTDALTLKAASLIGSLFEFSIFPEIIATEEQLLSGPPKPYFWSIHCVNPLSGAWLSNIWIAESRLRDCRRLEEVWARVPDLKPKELFEALDGDVLHDGDEKYDIIARAATQQNIRDWQVSSSHEMIGYRCEFWEKDEITSEDIKCQIEQNFYNATCASDLFDRYPVFKEAETSHEAIAHLRNEIANALKLPLRNGCFDLLTEEDALDCLDFLLKEAPEQFPPQNLRLIQRLATNVRINGRQTISLEDLSTSPDHYGYEQVSWSTNAQKLLYRLGLTPQQESWAAENTSITPTLSLDAIGQPRHTKDHGVIAQLGERCVRNAEVRSSILLNSTMPQPLHYTLAGPAA